MTNIESFFIIAMLGAILASCWLIIDMITNKKMRFWLAFTISGLTMSLIAIIGHCLY